MPGPVVSYILTVERKRAQWEEMGCLSEAERSILKRLDVRVMTRHDIPSYIAAHLPHFLDKLGDMTSIHHVYTVQEFV
jgi:hypothetical protein